MARLPRLPPAAEHHLVKLVCGLPPRAQRLLFGPPPVLDGQTLAMDIHALLWLDRLVYDEDRLTEKRSVGETRAERLKEARIVAHRPPIPMARVEALEIPGPAGAMGARLYVPTAPPVDAAAAATSDRDSGPSSPGQDPLLVYFHGGGWVIGGLDTHDDPCRFLAARSGARVLSVDYRLAPSTRSRPPPRTPSPPTDGRSPTPIDLVPTRTGSASAATAPAAISRPLPA